MSAIYHKVKRNPALLVGAMVAAAALSIIVGIAAAVTGGGASGSSGQVLPGPVAGFAAAEGQNDADTLSYRLNTRPVFAAGGRNGTLFLENPAENRYNIQVDIELPDGDVIYSSPVLEPDTHIDTDDLSRELSGGVYDAQARIFVVDPGSGTIEGHVLQDLRVTVE
ncbi:MAG: hypothetical protein KH009_09155 [Clostridiales bacterium]|nr:hypothetical protein [Clostridiales bacterium]